MEQKDPRRNCEGYLDLTRYEACKNVEEEKRVKKLLRTIFYICNLAGFSVENRIILMDNHTGKVWK